MKKEPKIIHIMADGKVIKNISGHKIPADNPVYEIILTRGKRGCLNYAEQV